MYFISLENNQVMSCLQRLLSTLNDFLLNLDNEDHHLSASLDLASSSSTNQSLAAVWPHPLPSATDWCRDVSASSIRTVSALFLHVVNRLKHTSKNSCMSTAVDCQLQVVTNLLLENCPVDCLSSLSAFLGKSLGENSVSDANDNNSGVILSGNTRKGSLFSVWFPEATMDSLKSTAKHPNLSRLEELTQSTCCEKGS